MLISDDTVTGNENMNVTTVNSGISNKLIILVNISDPINDNQTYYSASTTLLGKFFIQILEIRLVT